MSDDTSDTGGDSGDGTDSFSEASSQGWLRRLGGSLVAALIGLIMVPAAIVLMYWNEGRAVDAIRALNRGAAAIVEIDSTVKNPDANGKLVHLSGMMRPAGGAAKDPVFGVTGDGLIRLSRVVEMYQWKQDSSSTSHNNLGGSKTTDTTYTYEKTWSTEGISSASFKVPNGHQNPAMQLHSAMFDGAEVTLGVYKTDPSVLDKVTMFAPFQAQGAAPAGYQATGEGYYHGRDPASPSVGDVRVKFTAVAAQTVSAAAALSSGVLTAYRDGNGYTIALAAPGVVSAATLFNEEKKSESTLTWILRGVGFVVVLIGFVCVTKPLSMLFAIVPFLESMVGAGAFLVALILAVPVTLVTIAVAWIVHRPLIGLLLLAAAGAALFGMRWMLPKRSAPVPAQ